MTPSPCRCGAPAAIDERENRYYRFVVRCSRNLPGNRGCKLAEKKGAKNREGAISKWNDAIAGVKHRRIGEVFTLDGEIARCSCGLMLPCHNHPRAEAFARTGAPDGSAPGMRGMR